MSHSLRHLSNALELTLSQDENWVVHLAEHIDFLTLAFNSVQFNSALDLFIACCVQRGLQLPAIIAYGSKF